MNKKIYEALKVLKEHCEEFELDCMGCEFHVIEKGEPQCYLMDRVPEEVDPEAFNVEE